MRSVADALHATEGTRSKRAKVTTLASALAEVAARAPERLPFVARFLVGTLLPTDDARTLGVGGSLVLEAACTASGRSPSELGALAVRLGDLGSAVGEAMPDRGGAPDEGLGPGAPGESLTLEATEAMVEALAATSSRAEKLRALGGVLAAASPREARYIVRAVLGELRVGAKEGTVEEAIATAFGRPLAEVRRAAGLVSDVGDLARLAHEDRLGEAQITLGRPIGFMLATPIETARGADLSVPHAVEDKIDGIRAQAHIGPNGVRLFARGKGSVTDAFPDVTVPLAKRTTAILDGELVVVGADGRPRPFSAIQPRLKKTAPDAALLRAHPARYLVYDLLFEGETSLLELPFVERRARLLAWAADASPPLVVHASLPLAVPAASALAAATGAAPHVETAKAERLSVLDGAFDAARGRGFEGLVLKRLDAPYAAGVRGFAWLKVKKALATLDVVIVAAERGSGRRAGTFSDYTFAVRDGERLVTIGKAYSGLTDAEIAAMSARVEGLATSEEKHGHLPVRPEVVLEVAFDGIQVSARHSSGFALRFPRIARVRDDKSPEDADTVETARALWEAQLASGHREHRAPAPAKQLRLFDDE